MKKIYSNTALLLTAVIWGFAFVAQSVGMDYVGAFTFQSIRSLLGAATLVPFILLTDRRKRRAGTLKPMTAAGKKQLVKGGVACGVMLTVASLFQQIGIAYTTVGKAGFITSMYLIPSALPCTSSVWITLWTQWTGSSSPLSSSFPLA